MTEVLYAQTRQHRQTYSMSSYGGPLPSGAPVIEMVPNPDFRMPLDSPLIDSSTATKDFALRPRSLQIPGGMSTSPGTNHRRAVSTLPTFSFNAGDTSGLQDASTPSPPRTPDEGSHTAPSRRGHRRGGSEFVGGDSRLGLDKTISTSPSKSVSSPLQPAPSGPVPGRRGHAHRRSAAMSSHDVTTIMQVPESSPRLSSSLPSSPMDHPSLASPPFVPFALDNAHADMTTPDLEQDTAHDTIDDVSIRPRVGFSENVEYIPRPLSTISSETEDSYSTHRGHSVNNSISSVLSLGSPSPISRGVRPSLSTTFEDATCNPKRRSMELSRSMEREGEWLKNGHADADLVRPISEPCAPSPALSFDVPESPVKSQAPRDVHRKKHSLGHAFGFDRRRSEPLISSKAIESSRLSSISLPGAPLSDVDDDADMSEADMADRPSSRRRLKTWAVARFTRKGREARKSKSFDHIDSPGLEPEQVVEEVCEDVSHSNDEDISAEAETDLDTVFNSQVVDDGSRLDTPSQTRIEIKTPTPSYHSSLYFTGSSDDMSPVLDLDAALGPFKTPPLGMHRARRELHSSRLAKDFVGPGGHYHRRTESAPLLAQFDSPLRNMAQAPMADVFEEDEDEESGARLNMRCNSLDGKGIGIQVVDTANRSGFSADLDWGVDSGLRICDSVASPTLNQPYVANAPSVMTDQRTSCLLDETILEEASPTEAILIVPSEDEPRSSSVTKSSNSSEAPTVLASDFDHPSLQPKLPHDTLAAPDAFSSSAFSSPDFGRRQGSFDTSRLGTSASSVTDNRTMSSAMTGENGHDFRISVDDVPSLTSSRSTMLSTRRDFGIDRENTVQAEDSLPEARRRKRASIQSLSQLVGSSFGPKTKPFDDIRPRTAVDTTTEKSAKKKEHRLKKLLFWKSKTQNRTQTSELT